MVKIHTLTIPITLAGNGQGEEEKNCERAAPSEQTSQTGPMHLGSPIRVRIDNAREMMKGN
jgi:hypothetical protein